MFGLRYQIFSRPKTKIDYWKNRLQRFDNKTGFISATMPLTVIMTVMIAAGTLMIDKQFEVRNTRSKTLSERELQHEREHKIVENMLANNLQDDYENKSLPPPKWFRNSLVGGCLEWLRSHNNNEAILLACLSEHAVKQKHVWEKTDLWLIENFVAYVRNVPFYKWPWLLWPLLWLREKKPNFFKLKKRFIFVQFKVPFSFSHWFLLLPIFTNIKILPWNGLYFTYVENLKPTN